MPRSTSLPQRSPKEWALRGALAAAATIAGYYSVAHTLAQVLVENDPALAYRLAPWDGRITAALAASLAGPAATAAERQRSDELARLALQQDPTAVVAASTLGLNAQIRGDTAAARQLFTYAQKLSRRDLATQLWMIEDAVGRDDIPSALRHYDIALRTTEESWELLFPVLSSASTSAPVRHELVKTLGAKPLWGEAFIAHVAASPGDPKAVSVLLLDLHRARVPVPATADAAIINALISSSFPDEAWRHYAAIRPGADRQRSRDPHFVLAAETQTPFDWLAVNDGAITTSVQRGQRGGIFEFSAPASAGGPLLQQVQLLPAGTYRLEGHSSGVEQPERSLPHWTLVCRADGRELGRVAVPNSSQAGGVFSGQFTVPADCPIQTLTLVARASDQVSGLSGQIDHAQLVPMG